MYKELFNEYELLVAKADSAFRKMEKEYGDCIKCEINCSDCCHSVFGLFLIESAYLKQNFDGIDAGERQSVLLRADKMDQDLLEIEKKLQEYGDNPQEMSRAIARARVRCPLLNDGQKCSMYRSRPITCRVYGIPAIINGRIHACWKAGFEKGKAYPAFDLDGMYRELYQLSRRMLSDSGVNDLERASLLVSVSKSIKTPIEEMIKEK